MFELLVLNIKQTKNPSCFTSSMRLFFAIIKDKNISRNDCLCSSRFLINSTFRDWNVAFAFTLVILLIYFVMISVLSLASNPDFRLKIDLKLLAKNMYNIGTFQLGF